MLDKNGKEIKVGDAVIHDCQKVGIVTEVGHDYLICNKWSDGLDGGKRFYLDYYITVITPDKPLQQLKAQAQQDIEAMIKKHSNILNQAGCSIDLSVNFHDVTQIGSDKPSQLVEVKVNCII